MKKSIKIVLLTLSTISFSSLSSASSSVDKLNSNIIQCFEQTVKGVHASKRACNTVIKSDFVSRENRAVAYHNRGVINLNNGDIDSAFRDFRRAIKFNPEMVQTKQIMAYLNTKMSNHLG